MILQLLLATVLSVIRRLLNYHYCTECLTEETHTGGPHQQCTEPSLTAEQATDWERQRQLPGVRLREPPPQPPPAPVAVTADEVDRMRFILMTLFVILYQFIYQ